MGSFKAYAVLFVAALLPNGYQALVAVHGSFGTKTHPATRDRRQIKTKLRSAEVLTKDRLPASGKQGNGSGLPSMAEVSQEGRNRGAQLLARASQIEAGLQPATAWIDGYPGRCPGLYVDRRRWRQERLRPTALCTLAQRNALGGWQKEIPQAESQPRNFGDEPAALNDATNHTIIAGDSPFVWISVLLVVHYHSKNDMLKRGYFPDISGPTGQ